MTFNSDKGVFFFLNSISVLTEETGILGQLQLPSVTGDSSAGPEHMFYESEG